jgi:hypothetical protein
MSTSVISLAVLLFPSHHLALSFEALGLQLFWTLLNAYFRLLQFCGKPGMRTILAGFTFWAETAEVKRAQLLLLIVLESTVWAEGAESAVVVRTRGSLRFRIDV